MQTLNHIQLKKWGGVALLFSFAALLLFVGIRERSFWTDEWYAFKYLDASFLAFIKEYWQNPDNHAPGYYLVLMAFVKLFGRHDFVARLPSLLAGFGALVMMWRIARLTREREDEQWPSFALALAATAPYLIILSQTARYFSLSAFLALVVTYAVLKIVAQGNYRWLTGYALALAATAYIDYPTALYSGIGSALIIIVHAIRKREWRLLRLWLFAVLAVIVVSAPLVSIALAKAQAEAAYGGDVLTSGPLAWLLRIGIYGYAALYGFVAFPWDLETTIPLALVFLLLVIVGFMDHGKRGHFWRRPAVLVVTVVGLTALGLNTALLSFLPRYTPLAYPRYASFALYLLFLLMAAFVWWITDKRRGIRFVIIVLLLGSSAWSLFDKFGTISADPTLFAFNYQEIYHEVELNGKPGDRIMINDDFPKVIYDWYHDRYFKNVAPQETVPGIVFFEPPHGGRLWVIGFGYDDKEGYREPRQKAEDIAAPLGSAVRILDKGSTVYSLDEKLRAFKKHLTGHDTYKEKVRLFLIVSATSKE